MASARGMRSTASSASAATTPTTSTVQASHGCQSGVRRSNTNAHTAVPASTAASVIRALSAARCRHSVTVPIPATAAIAGASATR